MMPPTLDGLPLIKPPYGRITAIDLNKGDLKWVTAVGDGTLFVDVELTSVGAWLLTVLLRGVATAGGAGARRNVLRRATAVAAVQEARMSEPNVTPLLSDERAAVAERVVALLRMADFQSNAGLLLGPWQAWQPLDWARLPWRLTLSGEPEVQRQGGHSLGDPSGVLAAWLRQAVSSWEGSAASATDSRSDQARAAESRAPARADRR